MDNKQPLEQMFTKYESAIIEEKCATVEKIMGLYLDGMINEGFTEEGAVMEDRNV